MNLKTAFFLALAAAACDHGSSVVDPPLLPVSIEPQRAYAGAPISIISAKFGVADSVRLYIDTVRLEIARRSGDTVVAYLPASARGFRSVELHEKNSRLVLGQIEIAGFAAYRPFTGMGYYLDVWPVEGVASIISGRMIQGNLTGEVVQMTPKTGAVRTLITGFSVGSTGARTPGQTPDPNTLLLQPMNGGNLQAWRLLPDTQFVGTVPAQNTRHYAQFSDSIFFRGTHHWIETYRRNGNRLELVYTNTYEETHRVYISPAKDRATLRVNGSVTGPPVFNTLTGETAYHVRQLFRSYGAAFSDRGDTLWMVGATREAIRFPEFTTSATALVALDARTGRELGIWAAPGYTLTGLAYDRDENRLFISATPQMPRNETTLDLFVVRATDLALLGHAAVPNTIVCNDFCDFPVIAVGVDGVFVVQTGQIFEFDYLRN